MKGFTKRRAAAGRGAESGATAVEFAMVAGPLFFMIFATLEVALAFIAATSLENAVARTARMVRTGEAQAAKYDRAKFEEAVCNQMTFLKDHCLHSDGQGRRLSVDVRVLPTFRDTKGSTSTAADDLPDPFRSDGGYDSGQLCFQGGQAGNIVLVRAYYRWPLLTPMMTKALSRINNNQAVLQTAETFRNEPFGVIEGAPAGTC